MSSRRDTSAPGVAADALAGVRIFAGLDASELAELAAHATRVPVRAGNFVFHQGAVGDALFVVLSGRLEVIAGDPPHVLRVLGRGDALGELALLTGSVRSASVRARRDSEILRVDAAAVTRLLAEEPAFALALTRSLAAQLQTSQGLDVRPSPIPETVGVVALPGAPPAAQLAAALTALMGNGRTARLTSADAGHPDDYPGVLDRAERAYAQVVLAAEDDDGEWRDFCLRQADRTLLLAAGRPRAAMVSPDVAGRLDVLLAGSAPSGTLGEWIDAVGAHTGRLIAPAEGWPRSLPPLARALAGRSTALVCSGGGARSFAHIGVIAELQEAGVVIDRLAGVSMGAVVAAQAAMGIDPAEIRRRCVTEFVDGNPIGDYTLPVVALVRGRSAEAMVERLYGRVLIEEMTVEFMCASCDLVTSELFLHRRGSLAEAVGASFCLPGVGPPVKLDDRLLVDGGVMNNLPVEAVSEMGEGPVIASDVTAMFELPVRRLRTGPAAVRLRDIVLGRGSGVPLRLPEVIVRSITLGSSDTAQAAEKHADAVIRPDVSRVGLLAFDAIDEMIEAGRRAARAMIATRPELVS